MMGGEEQPGASADPRLDRTRTFLRASHRHCAETGGWRFDRDAPRRTRPLLGWRPNTGRCPTARFSPARCTSSTLTPARCGTPIQRFSCTAAAGKARTTWAWAMDIGPDCTTSSRRVQGLLRRLTAVMAAGLSPRLARPDWPALYVRHGHRRSSWPRGQQSAQEVEPGRATPAIRRSNSCRRATNFATAGWRDGPETVGHPRRRFAGDKIGPAVIATHSAGGPFGWLVADQRPRSSRPRLRGGRGCGLCRAESVGAHQCAAGL